MDKLDWIIVGTVDDIPRQGSRLIRLSGGDIALFRAYDDAVFALHDRCPHKGGPLSQGIVHGHKVACPLHNWVIALEDGQAQAPDKGCAHRVPVTVTDGVVRLGLPAVQVVAAE